MEWASFCIGLLALFIAAYGIVERQRATARELRGQFASTIRELHALPISEEDYDAAAAQQFRRALLTQQAVALESMVDARQLTSEEYSTLAYSLDWLGETRQAIDYWAKATRSAGKGVGVMQAAPWRGYAWSCFEEGRLPQGRRAIREALALSPRDHDRNRWDVVQTCAEWLQAEQRLPEGVGEPTEPLEYARTVLADVDDASMLEQMKSLVNLEAEPTARRLQPETP